MNSDALYVRGLCLYYEDMVDKAFQHFQQVLRLAPDHGKAKEIYKVNVPQAWKSQFYIMQVYVKNLDFGWLKKNKSIQGHKKLPWNECIWFIRSN